MKLRYINFDQASPNQDAGGKLSLTNHRQQETGPTVDLNTLTSLAENAEAPPTPVPAPVPAPAQLTPEQIAAQQQVVITPAPVAEPAAQPLNPTQEEVDRIINDVNTAMTAGKQPSPEQLQVLDAAGLQLVDDQPAPAPAQLTPEQIATQQAQQLTPEQIAVQAQLTAEQLAAQQQLTPEQLAAQQGGGLTPEQVAAQALAAAPSQFEPPQYSNYLRALSTDPNIDLTTQEGWHKANQEVLDKLYTISNNLSGVYAAHPEMQGVMEDLMGGKDPKLSFAARMGIKDLAPDPNEDPEGYKEYNKGIIQAELDAERRKRADDQKRQNQQDSANRLYGFADSKGLDKPTTGMLFNLLESVSRQSAEGRYDDRLFDTLYKGLSYDNDIAVIKKQSQIAGLNQKYVIQKEQRVGDGRVQLRSSGRNKIVPKQESSAYKDVGTATIAGIVKDLLPAGMGQAPTVN